MRWFSESVMRPIYTSLHLRNLIKTTTKTTERRNALKLKLLQSEVSQEEILPELWEVM